MINTFFKITALALAAGLAVAPATSVALQVTTPQRMDYAASFGPLNGLAVPWTGELQLTMNPDGIIQGYYRPDDNHSFIPVTGGFDGNRVWIEIGGRGTFHVNGTIRGDKIVGSAINLSTNALYSFNARIN